ncbi:hypothetical protein [Rhabdaerophilum calidifontis]|uniref:hypothetical protein n=1 Tax=Rhabdaerophilum calidifontis TaxID=2604328 RepID=UPI001FE2D962|nr:hypothetical protein [Rhabdaerophilum calidifontis]
MAFHLQGVSSSIRLLRWPAARQLAPGAAVIGTLLGRIAASPWMRAALRFGAIVLAVLLFLLALRRTGERAGRLAERLETTEKANDVKRRMLEAAARRPRDHHELVERLRDGGFLRRAAPGIVRLGSRAVRQSPARN